MYAAITNISYYLPPSRESLQEGICTARSAADLAQKIGIEARRVAAAHEYSSDLGVAAARQLLEQEGIHPQNIDFLLFCTQTPDFCLPASACLIHAQLGLPSTAGALDFNLGCSGFVYGLSLAKGLIESGQANRVLLITADTHSKLPWRAQTANVYGDGAAATLIEASDDPRLFPGIGPFVFGTDGTAAGHITSAVRGFRGIVGPSAHVCSAGAAEFHVDSLGVFEASMHIIPPLINEVLARAGLSIADIQTAVFYQASRSSLELLRRRTGIPKSKMYVSMQDCGNVSSSNIPIALKRAADEGLFRRSDRILLVGFGSGLSWAGTVLNWGNNTTTRTQFTEAHNETLEEQETHARS